MTEYPAHWTCQVTVLRLEAYLWGTVPRGEALAIAEHLEACAGCAQRLALAQDQGPILGAPVG